MATATVSSRELQISSSARSCRRKFLRFFPNGFKDQKYFAWERGYKWAAHEKWKDMLSRSEFRRLLDEGQFAEIAARALKSLSGTNLLFSFENMALRDAVRTKQGSHSFAEGLYQFVHGRAGLRQRFEAWCSVVESLPKIKSRVFTHPVVTVFGLISQPETHIFLKPTVTRVAAERYGFDFGYHSRPSWDVYANLLKFAEVIRKDLADLDPLDMIDIQSFIWVQGSDEYN